MAALSVVVAEDDPVLNNLYQKKLVMEGFEVRCAHDGEEAMKLLREQQPDILLLDVQMPKADGFQVLREFPAKDRKFRVVMLTNFDQSEFKLRALELGADDYFVKKDMTMRTLIDMIKKVLKLKA